MPTERLTLRDWRARVGELPPLVEQLAIDLAAEGRAPANAVAEAVRTLEAVARKGKTQNGGTVPFRVRHAAMDAVEMFGLLEAKGSLAKASTPEPWSASRTSNWVARLGGLPDYIQHVSHGVRRSSPGISESEAIQRAIGIVKNWAAGRPAGAMKGKPDADTQAAAAKAVAEWEKMKSKQAAKRAAKEAAALETPVNERLVEAASRLRHVVSPIPDQAAFAVRYSHRMTVVEGLLLALSRRERPQRALDEAARLVEADGLLAVGEIVERLQQRRFVNLTLLEALGYGSTPIRAKEGRKGSFHGMHGVERAARRRSSIPGGGMAKCAGCGSMHAAEADCPRCGSVGVREPVIAEAAAAVAAPQSAAVFDEVHPRAARGEFASKGGVRQQAAPGGAAGSGGPGGLAAALRASDPEFQKQQAEIAASVAYGKAHPAGVSVRAHATAVGLASQEIQDIGYGSDAAGISQFQKDNGLKVTGVFDQATLATVNSVYRNNTMYAMSRRPNFTGIPGVGARVSGRRRARGRSTAGAATPAKFMEGSVLGEAADVLIGSRSGAPLLVGPPSGTNHANTGPDGGPETRQPGGDDFDFDEPPTLPPGLGEHEGVRACASCVHFSPNGWVTSRGVQGGCMLYTFPVDRLDVCDSWLTLTPPDAPLRVFEARLREAEENRDGTEIMAARAALRIARGQGRGEELLHPASLELNDRLMESLLAEMVLEERDVSTAEREALAKKGRTFEGQSYPINSPGDLDNAIKAWGRAKPDDRPALKRFLLRMAKKLKVSGDVLDRIRGLQVDPAS